jgi:hypothetical protein
VDEEIQVIKADYKPVIRNINTQDIEKRYTQTFKERRGRILEVVSYLPQIQQMKKQLTSKQEYKAVFEVTGEGLSLWADKDGKILPSLKDAQGRIRKQARLVPMPKETYPIFNDMLLQNKLQEFSEQLEQVDKKVELILKGQHNDRISIIEGAQDTIQQAFLVKNENARQQLLSSAINDLNQGRRKIINETLGYFSEFQEVPKTEFIKLIYSLIGALDFEKMNAHAVIVQKNMQVILEATYYQIMAFDLLGEHINIKDITDTLIKVDINNLFIEREINKWLGEKDAFTFNIYKDAIDTIKEYRTFDSLKNIEMEFTGEEIL